MSVYFNLDWRGTERHTYEEAALHAESLTQFVHVFDVEFAICGTPSFVLVS